MKFSVLILFVAVTFVWAEEDDPTVGGPAVEDDPTVGSAAVEDDPKLGGGPATILPQHCFNCQCPRNFFPKCGSDGLTYQNECMMQCAKKRCPELTKKLSLEPKNIKNGA